MKLARLFSLLLLFPLVTGRFGTVQAQGAMIVTGHDPDLHHFESPPPENPYTEGFITACLDFLVFGKKAAPEQVAKRGSVRIAYLGGWGTHGSPGNHFDLVSGYANPKVIDILDEDWRGALVPGAYDVVIVSSFSSNLPGIPGALAGGKELFQTYLNKGGKLFVLIQNHQEDYGFLPTFGAAVAALDVVMGNFYATRAGDSIGLTDGMINKDMTHQQFKNVDTSIFKVFERTRETTPDGQHDLPITIGFNGIIKDTVFVPVQDSIVQRPRSTVPSGIFQDSLCVEFYSPTEGATLLYSLDGSNPALSPLRLPNHGRFCFHETTTFRVLGRKTGWLNSPDTAFTFFLKPIQPILQVAKPQAAILSGTSFPDSLCVTFSTATPGAVLHYAADGIIPDSNASLMPASGTLCFHQTTTLSLMGTKSGWKPSDTALFTYLLKPPRLPSTLALYAEGEPIDVVTPDYAALEVRLIRAAGVPCAGCTVQVTPSGGGDRESLTLSAQAGAFSGGFLRMEGGIPVPGDGTLQHLASDSIVLVWINPEDAGEVVRRSYPYVGYGDILAIEPQNDLGKTVFDPSSAVGPQWIISDAPGLVLGRSGGSCCSIATAPVNAQSPDSLRLVGFVIEASRGFSLDLKVYSHLGAFVHQVAFTVPESEFLKLSTGKRKGARFLRLLWNGTTRDGTRAGNGVYVFKTAVAFLPVSGEVTPPARATSTRRVGILRSRL